MSRRVFVWKYPMQKRGANNALAGVGLSRMYRALAAALGEKARWKPRKPSV